LPRCLWFAAPLLVFAVFFHPARADTPIGAWLTEGGDGVVEITACGSALCGRVIGMAEPRREDGQPRTDPRGRPICGLEILQGAVEEDPGAWFGQITDPDDDSVWDCRLTMDDSGRLHLRGYVLTPLLGETQVWTRYTGRVDASCRMG
jgi:uncharacterized protein (DUF2147 family)